MAARRKPNGSKNIENRLGALRSDFDELQSDVKGLGSDVGEAANDRVKLAIRNAESVAERALRLAEESVTHAAEDVEAWTNDNLESARDSVRAKPLAAMLLSMGAGALIGAIFMRR